MVGRCVAGHHLKIGFGMERMPCGHFAADAAFFGIGVIAHNLCVPFQHSALSEGWQRHQVAAVFSRLFHLRRELVRHAGGWVLKIAHERLDRFHSSRARHFACATENPSPQFPGSPTAATKAGTARHCALQSSPAAAFMRDGSGEPV